MAGVILVAGEALIDLVPSSAAADSLAAHPGGGPFNAAPRVSGHAMVLIDPNVRSDIIPDPDAYRARRSSRA